MEQSSSSDLKMSTSADAEFELGLRYKRFYGHDPAQHETIRRFLDLLPASDARVLDLGCGTGKPVSHMVAARGHRAYGIDIADYGGPEPQTGADRVV